MQPDYNKITKYISAHRLQKYEQVCGSDEQKVLKLYQTNLRLSQAFYPLLSLFEVVLRNALNEEIKAHFNDPDWLKNQRNRFMSHPRLTYTDPSTQRIITNDFLKKSVNKIINKQGSACTQGKIIADLNFGFWTELFEKNHYSILHGRPIKIFSKLPSGTNRNIVNQKLERIRKFRNRVYHNEPIIFSIDTNGVIVFSFQHSNDIYHDIIELFQWLDLDYKAWTKRIDNIPLEIERANHVYKSYPAIIYYINRMGIGLKHYKHKYL